MIAVLRTVGRRRVIEFLRYPFDLVTGMCVFYVIFLAIFYGDRSFGSEAARSGTGVSALVIGFVVFVLTQQTFQAFGQQLINESAAGTCEGANAKSANAKRKVIRRCVGIRGAPVLLRFGFTS